MRPLGRTREGSTSSGSCVEVTCGIMVAIAATFAAGADGRGGYCTQTADALFVACKGGTHDDAFVKRAVCINISDGGDRSECFDELREDLQESRQLCQEQHDWRLDACRLLGEDRYDPVLDPAAFDDDFTHLTNPNPYFPLTIGNRWRYAGGGEINTVEVRNQTKAIAGLTAIVFLDQVFVDGDLTESTNDWYTQARDGTVWYMGEETGEYESFDGDRPRTPELVSIEGSFKTGRDGAKPGIIFLASPRPGAVYLEEYALGTAEDVTQILSTTYAYGRNTDLDQLVPRQLADRFCAGDCVVTKNFSLLEPGVIERKYYARGIGVFLEVEFDTRSITQLVDCSFDPRCVGLPSP